MALPEDRLIDPRKFPEKAQKFADPAAPEPARDRVDALLWNFTVLGEASNQISTGVKVNHPEVPWADPVRLRNRIVHGYWSVDLDVLVATSRDDLPALLQAVRRIRE